jgi:hypothetical protein
VGRKLEAPAELFIEESAPSSPQNLSPATRTAMQAASSTPHMRAIRLFAGFPATAARSLRAAPLLENLNPQPVPKTYPHRTGAQETRRRLEQSVEVPIRLSHCVRLGDRDEASELAT